jgi:hypothetical protein
MFEGFEVISEGEFFEYNFDSYYLKKEPVGGNKQMNE